MRVNVSRGRDPLGLIKYILDPTKQRPADREAGKSPILKTNMVGRNATELAEEFRFSHDLNPRVLRTMTHYSISLPPGEQVEEAQKIAISQDLLDRMGHQDCQYLIAAHHDQEHKNEVQHWHICTSSVDLNGRWVADHFNYVELKQAERDLEVQHGLRFCPPRSKGERRNLTSGEHRQEERTGVPCTKRLLWEAIDRAAADQPSMTLLVTKLKAQGVEVQFDEFPDGGKGLTFGADGKHFKGHDLGDRYSFEGLKRYAQIGYDSERDDTRLRELNAMTAEQCQALIEQQADELRRQQRRDHYRQLYRQYAPPGRMEPRQRDQIVAKRALQDRQPAKTVVLMVGLGRDEAQPLHQPQADEAAIEYGAKIVQAAIHEQDRGIDR